MKALLVFLLLTSCAAIPNQALNTDTFYRRDMGLTVDGYQGTGTIVVPRAASHHVDIQSAGTLDLFTFETCHRENSIENAGDKGWFADRHHAAVDYVPIRGLEDTGSCVIRMGGYERTQGRHSWAMIDFEDAEDTLPADVKCNGEHWQSRGVTICQAKQGLIEQITFPVEVVISPTAQCPMPEPSDGKTFLFNMPARECVYAFTEVAPLGKQRRHRLTTVGYQSILIRSN